MSTIVVSLACLLQFGTCVEEELPRRVLRHPSFRKYAQGKLTCIQAAKEIAVLYEVNEPWVLEILENLCNSCKIDEDLLFSLKSISSCINDIKLVGWIDIPAAEWDVVHSGFLSIWKVFTDLRSTLPSPKEGEKIILIVGDVEEATLLNCAGMEAIPFTPQTRTACFRLFKRMKQPQIVEAGRAALRRAINTVGFSRSTNYTKKQICMVDICCPAVAAFLAGKSGPLLDDIFSSPHLPNILEQVGSFVAQKKIFGFNGIDFSILPPDMDTMSHCITAALEQRFVEEAEAAEMLDLIISNVDAQGRQLVYFDESRPRTDPVATGNMLFLAYLLGQESNPVIRFQERLVQEFLLGGGYKWGTLYYPRPESFLFYYGRLLHRFRDKVPRYEQLRNAIKDAVVKLFDSSQPQIMSSTAQRIILCSMFEMEVNELDIDMLLQSQLDDGSWPFTHTSFAPTRNLWFYNETLEIVFILTALLHAT